MPKPLGAKDLAGLGGNATNATETKDYNELATLLHVSSDDAIRHLLTRGTHREFGYGPLFAFLVIYSIGAYIAGSSIASGLFVPMLVMGAGWVVSWV